MSGPKNLQAEDEGSSNCESGRCEVQSESCDCKENPSLANISNNVEDTLSNFRQLWQKELEIPNSGEIRPETSALEPAKTVTKVDLIPVIESDEQKAERLFLQGAEYERNGDMYEAIKCYKRSVQLIPDIERRVYHAIKLKSLGKEQSPVKTSIADIKSGKDSDVNKKSHNQLSKIKKEILKSGRICICENDQNETHFSALPYELITYILRWVVSNDLDMASLEKFGSVCRGFYAFARDSDIWRIACIKTWGINCGVFNTLGYSSWREMFISRTRLKFNGCYISKTTYIRPGENSFQDQFYRPWHLIRYFRYLRFFPEGIVLMMTTPDEPVTCLDRLKHRYSRTPGVLCGHYRLTNDKVIILIGKSIANVSKSVQSTNTRFKSRRKENMQESTTEDTFHIELQIKSYHPHTYNSLSWCNYSIISRNKSNGSVINTEFEITKNKFPIFKFYQVGRFHAKSDNPL